MQWLWLLLAGFLEVGWAVTLKLTNGWTNLPWLAVNILFGLAAAFSLSQSMKQLSVVVAYPIWKGLAICGLLVWETWIDRVPVNALRIIFAVLIVVGIVGLKVTSDSPLLSK